MRTPTKVFIGGIVAFTLLILNVSVGDGAASPPSPRQLPQESIGKDGAPMRLVPAGEFMMGSNDGLDNEKPPHRVYVDAFYMDKFEATTSRYKRFLEGADLKEPEYWETRGILSSPTWEEYGDRPVVGVTWHDADAYCRHYGKRLPTEAEWEKAARGTDERKYPWGNQEPSRSRANYDEKRAWEGYRTLSASGSHQSGKSPYGIHDMAGNVWEWVADWYDDGYYKNSPNRNPKGPSSGDSKVLRGGSWGNHPDNLRSADRGGVDPTSVHNAFGFRCLQDIPK